MDKLHELEVACPVCDTIIMQEHPYPDGGYDESFEKVNRHSIAMHLLAHMMKTGCLKVKEVTPYEKCHKCGKKGLWENMHMHGDSQNVFCHECYDESCHTGDWGE